MRSFSRATFASFLCITLLASSCDIIDLREAAEFRSFSQNFSVGVLPKFFSFGLDIAPATVKLDVLIVVDDSGSMTEEQAAFQAGLPYLIQELRDSAVEIDYRIGITTTDGDHTAASPSGATPPRWIGRLWGTSDLGCGGACYGDGSYYFQSGSSDFANSTEEDTAFQNAIASLTINGSGTERGLYVSDAMVNSDLNVYTSYVDGVSSPITDTSTFFRRDSYRAIIMVSDEDECSNGSGCTTAHTTLFNSIKALMTAERQYEDAGAAAATDDDVKAAIQIFGILNVSNFTVYRNAINLFGEDGTCTGSAWFNYDTGTSSVQNATCNILNISTANQTVSDPDYQSFLSNVGSVLATETRSLAGTSQTDLPAAESVDAISVFRGGSALDASYRYGSACGTMPDTSGDALNPTEFYCIDTSGEIKLLFNLDFVTASQGLPIVVRWANSDKTLSLNHEFGLSEMPNTSTMKIFHTSALSDEEIELDESEFTYDADTKTITIVTSDYCVADTSTYPYSAGTEPCDDITEGYVPQIRADHFYSIGDSVRIEFQGGGSSL